MSRYYTFTIAVLVSTIAVLVSTIAVLVLAERGAYLAATEAADGIGACVSHPRHPLLLVRLQEPSV